MVRRRASFAAFDQDHDDPRMEARLNTALDLARANDGHVTLLIDTPLDASAAAGFVFEAKCNLLQRSENLPHKNVIDAAICGKTDYFC